MASTITFSDEAKVKLAEFLRSVLYARVKKHVLDNVKVDVLGSSRDASQTALDLALKEGMHRTFQDIEAIALPDNKPFQPVIPTQVQKRPKTETDK